MDAQTLSLHSLTSNAYGRENFYKSIRLLKAPDLFSLLALNQFAQFNYNKSVKLLAEIETGCLPGDEPGFQPVFASAFNGLVVCSQSLTKEIV